MLLVFLSSKWPDVIVWNRLFHSSNLNYSKWNKSCNTWNVSNLPWLECYLEALIIFDRLFWHTFLNLLNFFFSIFSKTSNATLSQTLPPSKVCYSPWVKFIWSKVYSEQSKCRIKFTRSKVFLKNFTWSKGFWSRVIFYPEWSLPRVKFARSKRRVM